MVITGISKGRTDKYSISRMPSTNQVHHVNRPPVELEDPRSTPNLKRYSEPPAFRHRCALCHKPRSSAYQRDHPIAPGEQPRPGVCSRPGCSAQKRAWSLSKRPPPVMVLEVHCYIYENPFPDNSTGTPLTVELPAAEQGRQKELLRGDYEKSAWTQKNPNQFEDKQQVPWVNRMTKPTFVPR
ncbi:hypothetical protein PV05_05487 [Exophiala xenobiotica]|uniref:Uncharacterized protein n=1 Tax=Exophiala xenobiotica TaxID=348802 RepID=A0A0D2FA16_9EURO|nr:uncharacterized protein PV05_05487 [Exophiala xenobiotica]KIW56869.1 hypothetical protein PV05_05487 [Exophiala xenobiotica]